MLSARSIGREAKHQSNPFDILDGVLNIVTKSVTDAQQGKPFDLANLCDGLSKISSGISDVSGVADNPIGHRVTSTTAELLSSGAAIAERAQSATVPVERQVFNAVADVASAITATVPEGQHVTAQVENVVQAADTIAITANDEKLPLDAKIMLGIAKGLQCTGDLTPLDDFVTAEVGKLLVRINQIVQCIKDQNSSDGLKAIQCTGEGAIGQVELIVQIVRGVRELEARRSIEQPLVENQHDTEEEASFSFSIPLIFTQQNHVKSFLNNTSIETRDYLAKKANQSVLTMMNAIYWLAPRNIKLEEDIDIKLPPHVLAEIYIEAFRETKSKEPNYLQKTVKVLMQKYRDNETTIVNLAAITFVIGAAHMFLSIDYDFPTLLAMYVLAMFKDVLEATQFSVAMSVFIAAMIAKDNVLPGGLLMLLAWAAIIPSLVQKEELGVMVENAYKHKTKHTF